MSDVAPIGWTVGESTLRGWTTDELRKRLDVQRKQRQADVDCLLMIEREYRAAMEQGAWTHGSNVWPDELVARVEGLHHQIEEWQKAVVKSHEYVERMERELERRGMRS